MHPALRKGPLFYNKHQLFPLFYKKTPPPPFNFLPTGLGTLRSVIEYGLPLLYSVSTIWSGGDRVDRLIGGGGLIPPAARSHRGTATGCEHRPPASPHPPAHPPATALCPPLCCRGTSQSVSQCDWSQPAASAASASSTSS